MCAKIRIIFIVILIAGASSEIFITSANDHLHYSAVTGGCLNAGTPGTATETAPGSATVHRDTMKIPCFTRKEGDTPLREDVYGWEFAWQEYNVSAADTVWFDDFLVVGSDTLLWEDVYGWEFAWQEYNVSAADTVWFDDFLVVGSDTLLWEDVYYGDGRFEINLYGPGPDRHYRWDPAGFNYYGGYFDPFYIEFLWQKTNGITNSLVTEFQFSYIAPFVNWMEIAVNNRVETERPLYTYYMGRPVQAPDSPAGLVQRRRDSSPVRNLVRSLLSSESRK